MSSEVWGGLEVQPDEENVVASRLEGEWRPEVALTERLTGGEQQNRGESPSGTLSFRSEPSVATTIPAKYEEFLGKNRVYMAGMMTLGENEYPFVLIQNRGNPHIVYFRDRDGDPLGDAESFNVILAPAKDTRNDLLFTGGDFNSGPFRALERVEHTRDK
jgi:hypothetical protein